MKQHDIDAVETEARYACLVMDVDPDQETSQHWLQTDNPPYTLMWENVACELLLKKALEG